MKRIGRMPGWNYDWNQKGTTSQISETVKKATKRLKKKRKKTYIPKKANSKDWGGRQ